MMSCNFTSNEPSVSRLGQELSMAEHEAPATGTSAVTSVKADLDDAPYTKNLLLHAHPEVRNCERRCWLISNSICI